MQTNGAGLDELKLTTLEKNKKNLHKLIINLPSVDPDTYQKRTGSVLSSRLMGNIKRATEADINTEIVVIGTKTEIDQNISAIQNMFSCKIIATKAHDVALSLIHI